ncbi:MAG: phosphoglucosamine mutase [Candidatus Binatia bacterium]
MRATEPAPAAPTRKLFGTDGVRGVANVEPVTAETTLRLGRAVAHFCRKDVTGRQRIVVGKDTRWSGDMLENALAAGICSLGVDVLLTGPVPTPAVAFLTRSTQAAAGAVISASHNPFQDNGIKFFAASGFKLPDEVEEGIEQLVFDDAADRLHPTGNEIGKVSHINDAGDRYRNFLKGFLPARLSLAGLKIVIDCAHGAAYRVGPELFRELGAEVVAIGVNPDGVNINQHCGAVHPERLQEAVIAERAHLGIALDGDADRGIFVDEAGAVVDGDEVLAMAATEMLARGTLKHATVVATVMSNIGLEVALRERGVRLVRVKVGDRYVVEEMRRHDYNLGGEQSGHLVFIDHSTTGDGLMSALTVARLLVERQRPLSELKRVMMKFPQVLLNVPVVRRGELETLPNVQRTLDKVAAELGDRGRVVVRYSGTEPLVRIMVEGEQQLQVQAYAHEIAAAIRSELVT